MKINVEVDVKQLTARTLKEQKRLAFNTAEALNKTALYGQGLVRAEITKNMTLRTNTKRGRSWLLEQVKVAFASAKKGLAFAEIYIANRDRLLLAAFETREQRGGFVGTNVAVPIAETARAGGSLAGSVLPDLTFRAMKLKKTGLLHHGKPILKGAANTFQIATDDHPLGEVFQRTGPGQDDVRVLYVFKRPFRLKQLIHVTVDAARAMREKFRTEWLIANAGNRQ